MKKTLLILLLFCCGSLFAQSVEVDLFQKEATLTTSKIGVRARATGSNVQYIGVTFYILYQSANASPLSTGLNTVLGVDDSKMVTTFAWGTSARFTNPQQPVTIDPGLPGGFTYDRRYVYGNIDESGGSNIRTLTTAWDTLLYITLNTLQPTYPQGGYAYQQNTSEAPGAALSDPGFANISYLINSGDRALGLNVVPVLFTKFNAKCNANGTLISWATAQESNSSHFEIERSANEGNSWTTIGKVSAAGNSNNDRNYQQIDLSGGTALYRIKQVDIDGKFIYTAIERTTCETKNITSVIYPVPVKDFLNVVIKSDKVLKTQLMVFETTGKLVRKMEVSIIKGNNNFTINMTGLASGEYFIRSTNPEIDVSKQFTVAH